jgi:diguanylate cyclase (GGDEF)-like protein
MLKMVSFPVVLGDMGADSIPALLGVQPNTLSILLLAMNNRGKTTAYVLLENDQPDAYKQSRAKLAQALVDEAGIAMENARLFQEVERLSTTDPLTGLYNRRYFESAGEREISLANRHQTPLMMLMLDIDHFKLVNDTYGHGTGDIVLAEVAENCRRLLRTTDLNVRLGGEEFGFLCPNTSADGALTLGERIRKTIEEYTFDAQNTKLHTTVSIGVAGFSHGVDKMLDLIRKSDQALYQAKSNGRNRTQLWDNGIK